MAVKRTGKTGKTRKAEKKMTGTDPSTDTSDLEARVARIEKVIQYFMDTQPHMFDGMNPANAVTVEAPVPETAPEPAPE